MRNRRWLGPALFFAAAALFLSANRSAYRGYFQDDEIDNLSWAPALPLSEFARGLITPTLMPDNFRPVGHFFFRAAEAAFGLHFPWYVLAIHAIHLINVWFLWLLIRQLGGSRFASAAGALLFAFNMAVFDVYWKPMYVFDLLCATFCLLAFLAWTRERRVLAFAAFWLAYKSKEIAVMLPFVLAAYEYWLGKRRWKPLVPFFAASLSFGAQGLLVGGARRDDYAFRYGPKDLWKSTAFYADRILLLPKAGFLAALLPACVRDRRVWLGMAAMALFFVPLLLLGGRLFGAYCYVPLIGVAVAVSGVADRGYRIPVALLLALWIPLNFVYLRGRRREALAAAGQNRHYVSAVRQFASVHPGMRHFIYDGRPASFRPWGIKGALAYCYATGGLAVLGIEEPGARALLNGTEPFGLLTWDAGASSLAAVAYSPRAAEASFIRMDRGTPVRQLGEGWFGLEAGYRWSAPIASARLARPRHARRFELTVNMPAEIVERAGGTQVRVYLNNRLLGSRRFTQPGRQTAAWDAGPGEQSPVEVRLESDPYPSSDGRVLGLAVVSFGFSE